MTKSMTVRPRINVFVYEGVRDYYKSEYGNYCVIPDTTFIKQEVIVP